MAEKEYIEREALLRMIDHRPTTPTTDREDRLIRAAISTVKNFPAADVRPARIGKWEHLGSDVFRCSECGYGIQPWNVGVNFCPNCGCAMEDT